MWNNITHFTANKYVKFVLDKRVLARIWLGLACVFFGLLCIFTDTNNLIYQPHNRIPYTLTKPINYFWAGFLVCLYWFFKNSFLLKKTQAADFMRFVKIFLFWGSGLVGFVLLIELLVFQTKFGYFSAYPSLYLFLNYLQAGCVIIFLLHTFFVWKIVVNYQQNNIKALWQYFFLPITLLLPILEFDLSSPVFQTLVVVVLLFELFFFANLRWIAYLNYRQKWETISLTLLLLLLVSVLFQFCEYKKYSPAGIIYYYHCGFALCLFAFILICSVLAILGLFFNLPTSPVFEQKSKEIAAVTFINNLFKTKSDFSDICQKILIQSIISLPADAGWLELYDEHKNVKTLLVEKIDKKAVFLIKKSMRQMNLTNAGAAFAFDLSLADDVPAQPSGPIFAHILHAPLLGLGKHLGNLVLVNSINKPFSAEEINLCGIYSVQAAVSLANYELMSQSSHAERYKEELEIARRVQASLIPQILPSNDKIDIFAASFSADVVGGDYYDIFSFSPTRFVIVIGDVSGKGTAAAFTMAQLKGVFHSLVQFDLPADKFMNYANSALARCLPKALFVTFTFLCIDTDQKKIQQARAGHCYTLYYDNKNQKVDIWQTKGMGLGILRQGDYAAHIQKNDPKYEQGDIILLYTDGILEAKNPANEEFGIDKLQESFVRNIVYNAEQITKNILEDVKQFSQNTLIDDDYSLITIKLL